MVLWASVKLDQGPFLIPGRQNSDLAGNSRILCSGCQGLVISIDIFIQEINTIYACVNIICNQVQCRCDVSCQVEFMRGLVVLVMEKMASDLPAVMEDEHLFCHLVDEAIFFDHELHQIYDYPAGLNSSMDILTVPKVFERWIEIEKKCKMFSLLLF